MDWEAHRWAAIQVLSGRGETAALSLEKELAAAKGSDRIPLQYLLTALYDALGDYARAAEHLEAALQELPKRRRADSYLGPNLDLLGFLHHAQGKHDQGSRYYRRAAKNRLKRVREDPYALSAALANGARERLIKRDLAGAKDLMQRALEQLDGLEPPHPHRAVIERWLTETSTTP